MLEEDYIIAAPVVGLVLACESTNVEIANTDSGKRNTFARFAAVFTRLVASLIVTHSIPKRILLRRLLMHFVW